MSMFIKKESGGVPYYAPFTEIGFCSAGITTRAGGVSEGHFASLNLGLRTNDTRENLEENVRRLCTAFAAEPAQVVATRQEHEATVRRVGRADAGIGIIRPPFSEGVDGLITDEPEMPLLAFFADCVPVLFCDPETKAVGVCHSGWRGTVQKIAAVTVREMEKAFGSRPKNIRAAIGPHIGPCCFMVDAPVYEAFSEAFPAQGGFARPEGEKYYIDLSAAVEHTLREAGIEEITNMHTCTACRWETFFSHRRTGGKRGCFAAIIKRRKV
ncbi:MAG: peptidoglycan editing factor PgeF [Ruminococcaceae bacterium]|nr:peptidoglycan editing factor PgeF [Oscillospiraceae bacterium]